MPRVRRSGLVAALVLATTLAGLAPTASAVIVHGAHGHFFGVTLHRGVSPTRIPGSVPAQRAARGLSSPAGNLTYQGGPVVHSSTSYLIYWTPSGESIPASWQGLVGRYFTDAAADSGKASNVYGVARQYTDASGFADYRQTFSPSQAIVDTQTYPTTDSSNCPSSFPHCITDTQLQQELTRLIAADHLPTDGASATSLPQNAPIYFVVLPSNVDECFTDTTGTRNCAAGDFCAYHSVFTAGSNNLLYAAIPTLVVGGAPQDPKSCQSDHTSLPQEPNGNPADVVLKYVSHEHNETITDPLGTAWVSSTSGNENGDNCNVWGQTFDAVNGADPNAFLPTLGGSAPAGTLYNQALNSDHYYLQSEWSNGDADCEMRPSAGTVTSQFSVPAGPNLAHMALSFNANASSSSNPYTSVSWDFGDSRAPVFDASGSSPSTVSHTYNAVGRYAVTLTLVDNRGNLATTTQQVPVGSPPTAAFTFSPGAPVQGSAVSFDGTGSSDPDSGVTITSYSWDFGDGTTASGAKPTHTYPTPGTYSAKLTVTNSIGLTNTNTQSITVDELPTAAFTIGTPQPPVNQTVTFDGSSSSDPDGSITSYAWSFGDGSAPGSTATPNHKYTLAGIYTVQLTVTDSRGLTTTASQPLTVGSPPTAVFTFSPVAPVQGSAVGFDGTGSSDPDSGVTITSYSWDFGDGTTATGAKPTHIYTTPGTYSAKLTVTNSIGLTNTSSQPITVDEPPTAAFTIGTPQPPVSQTVTFDGSSSSDPDGSITSYAWNFGDGSAPGSTATPNHKYTLAGIYTVQLTVTDSARHTNTVSQPLTVGSAPTSAFTFSPSQPFQGGAVSFDGTGSSDPDPGVTIASYSWDFGDGTTATGANATPTHTYTTPGTHTYTAKLTVTNSIGLTNQSTQSITVDELPTAGFSIGTPEPMAGQPVSFNDSSNDPDGSITAYAWNFGDGTTATGPSATATHTYATAGPYTVQLTVTDSDGRTSNPVTQQLVVHPPPTATFTISPSQPLERAPVSFNFTGSTEPGTTITAYAWSFGDGTPPASGTTPSHSYASPGTYTVRLTVTNNLGLSATTSQPVTVADELPHAAFVVKTAHPASGQPVSFDGSSSSDPDGSISSYRWDFGDGTRAGSGSKPTHVYRKPGSYTVRLTITDSAGLSVTARGRAAVALAGRITKISFANGAGGAKLLVAVNGPGVVSAGRKTARVKKAGTAKFAIRLTAAQQSTLSSTDQLKLPIQIHFTPLVGLRSARTITIVFLPAGPGTARISAVLHR